MNAINNSSPITTLLGVGAPGNEPPTAKESDPTSPSPQVIDPTAILRRNYDINTPAELKRRHQRLRQEGEFLIAGLIPRRTVGIVVGDSGIGKSPLLYQAAMCAAAGVPFLGRPTTKGPVLYLDFENGVGQVDEMLDRLAGSLGLAEPPEALLSWNANDAQTQPGGIDLPSILKDLKPSWLIVDSLSAFHPEAEEKASYATRLLTGLRTFVREHGLWVTLVHHLKKTSTRAVVSAMGSSEYAITRERDAPIVRRQTAAHTVHLRIASQPESARIQVTSPTGCDGRDGGVNSRRGRRRAGRTHQ